MAPAPPQPAIDAIRQGSGVGYSDVQYAIRFDHAADFTDRGLQLGEMLQAVIADHEIEGSRLKRHAGRVGKHVRSLAETVGPLQIEPDHQNVLSLAGETARTGAEIEYAGAGWKISNEIGHWGNF
jgi:hypothetical protein